MKVYINDKEIHTFEGARLQDALLTYSKEEYKRLLKGEVALFDKRGNGMDADGRLWDGIHLYIKTI